MRPGERTHCLRGHPLAGPQIRHQKIKGRWRRRTCLECERLTKRARIIRKVRGEPEQREMYG